MCKYVFYNAVLILMINVIIFYNSSARKYCRERCPRTVQQEAQRWNHEKQS